MVEPNLIGGLLGGALIGIAASALLLLNGRIAGISGIFGGIFLPTGTSDRLWRVAFVTGLVCGAAVYAIAAGGVAAQIPSSPITMAVAGLLVGFGTRLGSGCTSGHGVCGLARRSPRSLVATVTFIAFGVLTVYILRHVLQWR